MKRVPFALFSACLVIVFAGVAISPQLNGQTEVPTEALLNAVRTINTAQVSYRDETGKYAPREEMLTYLRKQGVLSLVPIDLENPKPYELALTTSSDGLHYQIALKPSYDMNDWRKGCKTALFSDEAGVIFFGTALGCEELTR